MFRFILTRGGATGVLAVLATAQSAPSWEVPGASDDSSVVWMDAAGHQAIARLDGITPQRRGEPLALMGEGFQALGPFGGDVSDVEVSPTNPSLVLAGIAPSSGSGGTLYRSTDAAATWAEVPALSGTSVYDIEFDPAGVAYLGTMDGVWFSADGGLTWTQGNLGIGLNDQTLEVTIDPNDSTRIWAGVADALGSQTQVLLLSTDSGATWSNRTPAGAVGLGCAAIELDPTNSNVVFAGFAGGFGGGAVYVSIDGGLTWANRSAGLPGNPINDLAHDGTRVLLVGGMLFGSQTVGLYTSSDLGVTWTAVHDGSWPNLVTNDIEIDPTNPNSIFVASAGSGVYESADGGSTWSFGIGGTASFSVNEICIGAGGAPPIYVGSSSVAVWKSTDGVTFDGASVGIGSLNLEDVACNPLNHDEIAVSFQGLNDGGIYSSTDGGATWNLEAVPGTRWNMVDFAPDGTLYALSDGPSSIAPEGIYRRDGGGVWTGLGPDQGIYFETELFGMAFSEFDPNLIVICGSDFGVAGHEPTVWISNDAGATWSKNWEPSGRDSEDVQEVAVLPDGTDLTMVACFTDFGSAQTGGVLRSTDAGATWADSNAGMASGAQCYGLDVSPLDAATVYVADDDVPNGAVYRSTDGGASWTSMGYTGRVRDVAVDPRRPLRVYVCSWLDPKVQYSDDGGATFTPLDAGLSGAGSGKELVLVPGDCNTLLLATSNGAYVEYEGGCLLEGDTASLSASSGGLLGLSLAAGPGNAARFYFVGGSVTGTAGIPAGSVVVPLTYDFFTLDSLTQANMGNFVNTFAALDANGMATAGISLPPGSSPALVGIQAWFAYVVFDLPAPLNVNLASNAVMVTIIP